MNSGDSTGSPESQGAFLRTPLTSEKGRTARTIRRLALLLLVLELILLSGLLSGREPLEGNLLSAGLAALMLMFTFTRWCARPWRPIVLGLCILMIAATTQSSLLNRSTDAQFLTLIVLDISCAALLPWGVWWQAALTIACLASFSLSCAYVPLPPDGVADWLSFLSVLVLSEIIAGLLDRNRDELAMQFKAIVESEKKLKTIFTSGTDIISINSFVDERYIDINDEFERVTGYSRKEVIGKTPKDIKFWAKEETRGTEDKELRTKGFVRDQTKGLVRNFEAGFLTKDGQQRWGLFSTVLVNLEGQSCVVSFARDITEQKKGEDARRRLAAIVESSEDAIASATIDGIVISWNSSAERLFGYSASEIIGRDSRILVDSKAWPDVIQDRLKSVTQGEAVPHYEAIRIRKNGTPVEVSVSLSPVYDAQESIVGISAIYKDLTEQKRARRDLRTSETKFKKIFEASSETITINALNDGTYIAVNDRFVQMMEYTAEEVIGKTVADLRIWTQSEQRRSAIKELLANGAIKNVEVEFESKSGRVFSSLFSAVVMEIENQPCVVSFVRDISERKRAEQSHSLLAAIVQSADDAVFSLDLETRITTWNPGAERLYGYSAAEIIGRRIDMLAPPDRVDESGKLVAKVLQAKTVERCDTKRSRKDGTLFDAAIVASPVYDAAGVIVGVSEIVRDITERRQTEQDLTDAREQALMASRTKSEFLATMSHEIRTPMTAIIGMADLLWESSLTPEQRGYLRIARTAGNALNTLIDSILDLSKIEGGHLQLEEIDFNLDTLVEESVENFTFRAHQKGLELLSHVEPDVPRALRGDPTRLRQVLGNLIGNAVKFTGHGEVAIRVEKNLEANAPGALRFSVGDTGVGIPNTHTEAVFEAFNQVDNSITRRYGGSGLGLAICKRLVDLMGGRIWLESEAGSGSIFYFTVSLRVQPQALQALSAAEPNLKNVRILVADDKASHRGILKEVLEKRGALVTEAAGISVGG